MDSFEFQLAQYRAKVNEIYFTLWTPTDSLPLVHSESTRTQHTKPLILVIEDNRDEWFLIRWILTKQFPDAQMIWLADSEQTGAYLDACESKEQSLPILILLDLYLPSVQAGLAILQRIKGHWLLEDVPLITMSRSTRQEDRLSALTQASDAFIVKPDAYSEWRDSFKALDVYWTQTQY